MVLDFLNIVVMMLIFNHLVCYYIFNQDNSNKESKIICQIILKVRAHS